MNRWNYTYHGLRVASDLHLPEWSSFECPELTGNTDVRILLGDAGAREWDGVAAEEVVAAREYRLCVPRVACFRVGDGTDIVVTPVSGVAARRVRPYVLGSAWGALCYQAGVLPVHASVVRVGDQAVVFCARPQGGKSTIAAQLRQMGYGLISDDLCRIDVPAAGAPVAYSSSPRLRLWRDAIEALGCDDGQLEPDHARAGKYSLQCSEGHLSRPLPVRAIYLLSWGEDWSLRRLSGLTAVGQFLQAATYRAEWLEPMELASRHVERCTELLRRVPVWQLARPRDLSAMRETGRILVDHWFHSEV